MKGYSLLKKGLVTLASVFYLSSATLTWADDTDIYLHNPNLDSSVKPNVLFVLDNSGSMAWDINGKKEHNNDSRMKIMQAAFADIMQNSSNLNVGLMKLNKRSKEQSRLTYPVTDIDKPLGDSVIIDRAPEILISEDDAHESNDEGVSLLSRNLLLGGGYLTALRFQTVGVPQGAKITSATIAFTASETSNNSGIQPDIDIRAGKPEKNSNNVAINPPFDDSNNKPSQRKQFGTIVTWTPGAWEKSSEEEPNQYHVDITPLLQEVVDDANWCGNDAASFYFQSKSANEDFRQAYSIDGSSALKPKLTVEYSGGSNGCKNEWLDIRIQTSTDDAFERHSTVIADNENYLRFRNDNFKTIGGIRYQELPIKQGAKILEAFVQLTAFQDNSTQSVLKIFANDSDNSLPVSGDSGNLSSRTRTEEYHSWTSKEWDEGKTYQTGDISRVIQEVINRENWKPGNSLMILMDAQSGFREVISYDSNPTFSPRLKIKVSSGGLDANNSYKVKDHLIALVNNMDSEGGTPLTPTYYEGAKYFRDGKGSHPSPINNVCQSNYTVLLTDGEANSSESDDWNNINKLTGGYTRPDGSTVHCDNDSSRDGERCARTLSTWLNTTDLSTGSNMDGTQNVFTHTIAFGLKDNKNVKRFLSEVAHNGSGEFYTADNATDLAKAFNNIITGIIEDESSFVSPGVTANQFNNSRHLSQVYYSVFKPSKTDRWQGNLKRYQLLAPDNSANTQLDIYDSEEILAVDKSSGFFKTNALSFWSSIGHDGEADGRSVDKGGAGENLPEERQRKLYTYLTIESPGGLAGNAESQKNNFDELNISIDPLHFGLSDNNTERRDKLIEWIRNPATWLGDPLHSMPALTTYGCLVEEKYCPEDQQQLGIFFGTNDGFLHGIDATTGIEQFAFMPRELLKNLDKLEANKATDRVNGVRPYGMDGSVTLWVNDLNNNGVIYGGADTLDYDNDKRTDDFLDSSTSNQGEFVYAYIGMRRGGRSYYALDVTALSNPKMLWFIDGSDAVNFPEFSKLGQTWSKPVKTKIKIGSTIKDVLIFSGGYDNRTQDPAKLYAQDTMGNAVYIVDARTGDHIWSASNDSDAKATLTLSKMNYSIPGGVRVIDLEGDGFADQLLFADVGGQVWRLYINNCTSDKTSECAVTDINNLTNLVWPSDSDNDGKATKDDGVFAYLGPDPKNVEMMDGGQVQKIHSRRFFVEPDASLFRLNGSTHLAMAIGTGNRPDPLGRVNEHVLDRAYVLASPSYANPAVDQDYIDTNGKKIPKHTTIRHGKDHLLDITAKLNVTAEDVFGESVNTKQRGWFITLEEGEKVMTESVTFEETVYFNTYLPSDDIAKNCNPVAGKARAYAVDLLTGNPVNEEDADGDGNPDRYTNLANSGLPPTTSILFPEGSKDALVCVGAECDPLEIGDDKQTTYWRQVR